MTIPTSSQSTPGDVEQILDMNYAFAQTAMLIAAVRLRVFTILAETPLSAGELADRMQIDPYYLERLLQGLQVLQLVSLEGDAYRLTPVADRFLVEGKASYLGGDTLATLDYVPAWFQLDQTLRTGIPYRDLGDELTAEAFFAPRVRDQFQVIYPVAYRTAMELKLSHSRDAALQILDLGAGCAPWSVAFAQCYPSSCVTALDLPGVVEQGQKHVYELGLHDRYSWISQSMDTFEFPTQGYDLIIIAHVLRFIGEQRAKKLLQSVVRSLRLHGTLIVADIFLAEDQQGPKSAITLNLSMLVNTKQGYIRTWREIADWLNACGLRYAQSFHAAGPFPIVFAQKEL